MKKLTLEPIDRDIHHEGGTENAAYSRSQSDQHLSTYKSTHDRHTERLSRTTSAAASTFPTISEVSNERSHPTVSNTPHVTQPPPASVSAPCKAYAPIKPRQSTTTSSPFEKQSLALDPMSDRVSTVLVWQNIVVSTREKKESALWKYMKPSKDNEPKTKCLLHNVSGAITGGLWAVMGTCSSSLSLSTASVSQVRPALANRLF